MLLKKRISNNKKNEYALHEFVYSLANSGQIKEEYRREEQAFVCIDKGGYIRATELLFDLFEIYRHKPAVVGVLSIFARMIQRDSLEVVVSQKNVSDTLGYKKLDEVQMAFKELEKRGFLSKVRSGVYIINPNVIYRGNRVPLYKAHLAETKKEEVYGKDFVVNASKNRGVTGDEGSND